MLRRALAPWFARRVILDPLQARGGATLVVCAGFVSLVSAQTAQLIYPTMDLNNDGAVSEIDVFAFLALSQLGNPMADLNFDGVIDVHDDVIAGASYTSEWPVPPGFTVHWSVTGERDPRVSPVDLQGVEMARDVEVIYQPNVPLYPTDGYHRMIRSPLGTYDNWAESYNSYMIQYLEQIRQEVRVRSSLQSPGRIGILDFESATPDWDFVGINQPVLVSRWENAVSQINEPALDQAFMLFTGFTPRDDATSWGTLSEPERQQYLELSWNAFGRDLFTWTLEVAREEAPAALWGFWGFPLAMVNVPVSDWDRRLNDNLSWLIEQVDVLCPAFYDSPHVEEDDGDSACPSADPETLVNWCVGNMAEALRVRHAYNQEARLLPYIWYHYGPNTCMGNDQPGRMISDTNAQVLLTVPKFMGADGVLLWGHFYPTEPAPEHASTDQVQRFVDQWSWLINSLHRQRGQRILGTSELP